MVTPVSAAQSFLNNLLDSLKVEYEQTSSRKAKQDVLAKYHERLQAFLMGNRLDTIKVTVDEIVKDGWTVTTRLHNADIEFKYSLTFKENMSGRVDSAYQFMLGLQPGNDTVVNFSFTGACQVNSPDDETLPTFRIFAFPVPLAFSAY